MAVELPMSLACGPVVDVVAVRRAQSQPHPALPLGRGRRFGMPMLIHGAPTMHGPAPLRRQALPSMMTIDEPSLIPSNPPTKQVRLSPATATETPSTVTTVCVCDNGPPTCGTGPGADLRQSADSPIAAPAVPAPPALRSPRRTERQNPSAPAHPAPARAMVRRSPAARPA
jgi:hypothetical protein